MRVIVASLKRSARKIMAAAMALAAFAAMYAAERPVVADVRSIAGQFKFSRHALPEVAGAESRQLRPTHPELSHLAWYWSQWGAAAALNDLDGDGLPNAVCYVDTRNTWRGRGALNRLGLRERQNGCRMVVAPPRRRRGFDTSNFNTSTLRANTR